MHVIRLRGPWNKRTDTGEPVRVRLPESAPQPDATAESTSEGPSTYSRKFNRPTGLNEFSRVTVCVRGWHGELERVRLNDQVLDNLADSAEPSFEADVSDRLQQFNTLEITIIPATDGLVRLHGEISINIDQRQ